MTVPLGRVVTKTNVVGFGMVVVGGLIETGVVKDPTAIGWITAGLALIAGGDKIEAVKMLLAALADPKKTVKIEPGAKSAEVVHTGSGRSVDG